MHVRRKILIAAALAMAGTQSLFALAPVTDDVADIYARAARIAVRRLPQMHLNQQLCNDYVATNALETFLTALDFDHTYFLADDVAAFRKEARDLDNRLARGDLDFAFKVYDVFMARLSNRVDCVNKLLEEGFDLTTDETYVWERHKAPWPDGTNEWNNLWRKKIKNIYAGREAARLLGEEKKAAEEQAGKEKAAAAEAAHDIKPEETAGKTAKELNLTPAEETAEELDLSPEEFIRKQFQQQLTVFNDNDAHWLLPLYLSSFTRVYDPHSDYMSANHAEDFDIQMKLSLVGIGALLSTEDGAAKIEKLIPGGPAELDGRLQPGDKIIAVAQGDEPAVDVLHWPLSKTVRLIRGEKDTRVVLTVIPKSDISGTTTKKIDLIRAEVKLEESAAKGSVETVNGMNVGVVRIPEFYADISGQRNGDDGARTVSKDVRAILDGFKTNDIKGLVLDLRNNGGGPLYEALELSGLFIEKGPVVQVKSSQGISILRDPDPDLVYSDPLIVLVNRQSASASEIVAAALKDYGRAVVVGDLKTHGKGTVQSLIELQRSKPELGTLKLTTASFYRIGGGSTQIEGVRTDIEIPSMLDYLEVGEEYLPHALPWSLIKPANFSRFDHLQNILPDLKKRSEERREKDSRYAAYRELLTYLGEKQASKEISLKLEDRLAMARHDDEMSAYLNKALRGDEEEEDPEDEEDKADLILDETLQILADLITLSEEKKQEPQVAPETGLTAR
ncbi:MAG: carboxy terminal-processing peptidase [Kiritimatiellia bacterium]